MADHSETISGCCTLLFITNIVPNNLCFLYTLHVKATKSDESQVFVYSFACQFYSLLLYSKNVEARNVDLFSTANQNIYEVWFRYRS